MVIFLPLDFILIVLAVLMFFGVGSATFLGIWLIEHAVGVGIVLLIIHILLSGAGIIALMEDYSLIGALCGIVHAIPAPFVVVEGYRSIMADSQVVGLGTIVNFILFFTCINFAEVVWMKAVNSRLRMKKITLIGAAFLYVVIMWGIVNIDKY